jgi:hypothetical protein
MGAKITAMQICFVSLWMCGYQKAFGTPGAAQTKPGLLSCPSFNHKNHPADNTSIH